MGACKLWQKSTSLPLPPISMWPVYLLLWRCCSSSFHDFFRENYLICSCRIVMAVGEVSSGSSTLTSWTASFSWNLFFNYLFVNGQQINIRNYYILKSGKHVSLLWLHRNRGIHSYGKHNIYKLFTQSKWTDSVVFNQVKKYTTKIENEYNYYYT